VIRSGSLRGYINTSLFYEHCGHAEQQRTARHQRGIANDLPVKMLVWEDDAGNVWIGYTSTETLKIRYKIEGRDDVLKRMAGARSVCDRRCQLKYL
jgi:hypothetical protein